MKRKTGRKCIGEILLWSRANHVCTKDFTLHSNTVFIIYSVELKNKFKKIAHNIYLWGLGYIKICMFIFHNLLIAPFMFIFLIKQIKLMEITKGKAMAMGTMSLPPPPLQILKYLLSIMIFKLKFLNGFYLFYFF